VQRFVATAKKRSKSRTKCIASGAECLKSSPNAITNQPSHISQCLTFAKKCNQSLSRLIVPRA
jgi:hypothetical protein